MDETIANLAHDDDRWQTRRGDQKVHLIVYGNYTQFLNILHNHWLI